MADIFAEKSLKPKLGGWALGNYLQVCLECDREFLGDKRAVTCSVCAYDHLMSDMGITESNPIVLNQATRRDHMKEVQTPYLLLERLKGRLKGRLEEGSGLSKDKVEEILKIIREEGFAIVEEV